MPSRSMSLRRNRWFSTSMTTPVVAVDHEAEGAADARAVEQRMDDDRVALAGRRRDPVGDEVREFLGRAAGHVQRQAARRHADLSQLAHRPEVGRAQEGGPGLALRPVALQPALLDPESREGVGVGRQLARRAVLRDGEVVWRVDDLPRLAVLDRVHPHRLGEKAADKLEGDRDRRPGRRRTARTRAESAACRVRRSRSDAPRPAPAAAAVRKVGRPAPSRARSATRS